MTGNSNRAPAHKTPILNRVSITSVDVANQSAVGTGRTVGEIHIDTSHYVGAVQVTPTLGDQWYVATVEGVSRLHSRIPYNDPNQTTTTPTQGQHVVGSGQGPVMLQAGAGNIVGVDTPLALAAYTTATRPSAASVPAGSHVYDTTLGKPIWSNGTSWTDATGTAV